MAAQVIGAGVTFPKGQRKQRPAADNGISCRNQSRLGSPGAHRSMMSDGCKSLERHHGT